MKLILYETRKEIAEAHGGVKPVDIQGRTVWGFIEEGTIHVFKTKTATKRDMVEFFAHELGHLEPPGYSVYTWEEGKADKFANVAVRAYDLMRMVS